MSAMTLVTCPRCPSFSWAVSAQDAADWLAMHAAKWHRGETTETKGTRMNRQQRSIRSAIRAEINPNIDDRGVPMCDAKCPRRHGATCGVTGEAARDLCDPAMDDLGAIINSAAAALGVP